MLSSTRARYALLAIVALAAVVLLWSVATGSVLGPSAATPAIDEDALSETGYAFEGADERPFGLGIGATGHEVYYQKSISDGTDTRQVGMATASTFPSASVRGWTFDPVGPLNTEELAGDTFEGMEEFSDIEPDTVFETELFGETAEVARYTATTELDGRETEVYAYFAMVAHKGDIILIMAAHPTDRPEGEQDVRRLMAGLSHPAEIPEHHAHGDHEHDHEYDHSGV